MCANSIFKHQCSSSGTRGVNSMARKGRPCMWKTTWICFL